MAEREAAGYKSDWPPLYHLAAAAITAPIETDGPPTFKYRNESIRRQLVPALGPEAILHTEDEQFPWQQEILIWHLGRFLSIIFTVGTLIVTYFVAIEVFDGGRVASSKVAESREPGVDNGKPIQNSLLLNQNGSPTSNLPTTLAFFTVALLAFNPRFLFTSMLFNYDSLTLLLSSIFLWLSIRLLKGYSSRWSFWILGGVAGLALVTKYLAAPLVLIVAILAFLSQSQPGQSLLRNTQYVIRPIVQSALAFLIVVSPWFAYLIRTFNEIDTYGPILGTLAPLIRGDGSDRTVEALFAWLSGGQAPAPAFIERQSYTAWRIMTELPTTFWGNPIQRPYPLNWFIIVMTIATIVAIMGLILSWRSASTQPLSRRILLILTIYCLLPTPFMLMRLFGARDALEAVQGRHILFLSGAAFAVLFVWGWSYITRFLPRIIYNSLLLILLAGAVHQLIFMYQVYPSRLPVRTSNEAQAATNLPEIELPGGAQLIDYHVSAIDDALHIEMVWQAGTEPAPEDYRLELALIDKAGEIQANWLGYQTQARYPTRAWEEGDIIRDEGWLPLVGLPAAEYEIQWRILGQTEIVPWQTLTSYTITQPISTSDDWTVWHNGHPVSPPSILYERQTIQFTIHNSQFTIHNFSVLGPDNIPRFPTNSGQTWANFIVDPDWPPGDYVLAGDADRVVLRVLENDREFDRPEIWQPLDVNFDNKIKLLGYNLPTRKVKAGDGIPLTLFWQGQEWMGEDFVIFTRLLDNATPQKSWGGYDRMAQEDYSTLLWAPSEIVTDGFAIPISEEIPDGVYQISVGWYRLVNEQAESLPILNATTGELTDQTAIAIGPIKVGGAPPGVTVSEIEPHVMANQIFGDQIRLIGADIGQSDAALNLDLYWSAVNSVPKAYTLFVHIRDATGETVAQKDLPPTAGVYPTNLWDVDEIIRDNMQIPIDHLGPGEYDIVLGLYDFATGERLPVVGSADGSIRVSIFTVGAE